jgi:hypothetical protein
MEVINVGISTFSNAFTYVWVLATLIKWMQSEVDVKNIIGGIREVIIPTGILNHAMTPKVQITVTMLTITGIMARSILLYITISTRNEMIIEPMR